MADTTLKELAQVLAEFEKEHWVAPDDVQSVTRHITQHIAKLMGKLGTVTEKWEHGFEPDLTQLKAEVIPDLLYYSLNLAATHQVDLEQAFYKRLEVNSEKIQRWRREGLLD